MREIKQLRINLGYTQTEVANKLGVSQQAYANYETKKRQPDQATLVKLADIFNVSTDYLLGREEKTAPKEEQQKPNTIKILGRDGSCVERKLTDEQIDLMKKMIEQMPDASDL